MNAKVLATFLALLPMPALAAPPSIDVGEAYIEAYQALDETRLSRLYAEDVRFVDATSARAFPGGGFNAQGRAAVVDLIRSFKTRYGVERLDYVVALSFRTDREVVLAGRIRSRVRDKNGARIYETPVVTILTIERGLVVEHRDYLDYAAGREMPR